MEKIITSAIQVTPEWLTNVLGKDGVLSDGRVTGITHGKIQSTFASSVWRLEVTYSTGASPAAPKNLFLKVTSPALAPGEFDLKRLHPEIVFYREIAPLMKGQFTIPCYDIAYAQETGASHLLLMDVSDTHNTCRDPVFNMNCERAIDSLADLHAFWWDHPRLGKDIGNYPSPAERQQEWIDTEKSTTAFMAALGDQLPELWRATYIRVLSALPALFNRHATGQNLTLVHGDAHLGNFLFPKIGKAEKTYIIDWQFWHPTIGGTDLAFMMATEWELETRRSFEHALLHRYYQRILTRGVQRYSWEACWNDYRLSVILVSIFIPVWRWSLFNWSPDMIALERGMTAFEDLNCSDLL